jgi:hypothetical protein
MCAVPGRVLTGMHEVGLGTAAKRIPCRHFNLDKCLDKSPKVTKGFWKSLQDMQDMQDMQAD